MLFFNFELILIKIGFSRNFKVAPKPGESLCTMYGTWSLAKFHEKWQWENSIFYNFS